MIKTAAAAPILRDLDDFLQFLGQREDRFELVDGRLVARAGASLRHIDIQANLLAAIHARLRGSPCRVSASDALVMTDRSGRRGRFPDLAIRCGPENGKWVERPVVLVEILSPETELVDRGQKLQEYRTISSLRHYLLVAQDRPLIEVYSRRDGEWVYAPLEGLEAVIRLDPPGIELTAVEAYEGIDFAPLDGPEPAVLSP